MSNDPRTGAPVSSPPDDRREYLLRPTGKPGDISGVPRKPTLDEVERFEAIAYETGNGVDLGIFQTALVRHFYPEFTDPNGLDRYVFSTFEREKKNSAFTLTSYLFNFLADSEGRIDPDLAGRSIALFYDPKNRADKKKTSKSF